MGVRQTCKECLRLQLCKRIIELDEKTAEFVISVDSGLKGRGLGWPLMRLRHGLMIKSHPCAGIIYQST
jgi:hypothetical protein